MLICAALWACVSLPNGIGFAQTDCLVDGLALGMSSKDCVSIQELLKRSPHLESSPHLPPEGGEHKVAFFFGDYVLSATNVGPTVTFDNKDSAIAIEGYSATVGGQQFNLNTPVEVLVERLGEPQYTAPLYRDRDEYLILPGRSSEEQYRELGFEGEGPKLTGRTMFFPRVNLKVVITRGELWRVKSFKLGM